MAAGSYDRLVQVLRASLTDNGVEQVEGFGPHGDPQWASKADISDGERWRAGEVQAHVTTRFRVRWSAFTAGLTPKDRLSCDGLEYDIVGIKEVGRRVELEITAAARIDQGADQE